MAEAHLPKSLVMRMVRLALLLPASPAPATAWATPATIVSRDLPLGGARTTAGVRAPHRFDLVGLHWQGSGTVLFRTRGARPAAGARGAPAAPEDEDRPDPRSTETRVRRGWRLGSPYWVGASDRIDYRTAGVVTRLRAWYVWSPVERSTERTVAMAGSPPIVPRSGWSADEKIVRARPRYAKTVAFAVVHHTAGANDYSAEASAAIVRGDRALPREGKRLERHRLQLPRRQVRQRVRGSCRRHRPQRDRRARPGVQHRLRRGRGDRQLHVAHDHSGGRERPRPSARLAAGRRARRPARTGHLDVSAATRNTAGARPVLLRAIAGHRDTGFTTCPGRRPLQAAAAISPTEVASIGLPKLYAPVGHGRARRADPVHRAPLEPGALGGDRSQRRRRDGRARAPAGRGRRLDLGLAGRAAQAATRGRSRAARRRGRRRGRSAASLPTPQPPALAAGCAASAPVPTRSGFAGSAPAPLRPRRSSAG